MDGILPARLEHLAPVPRMRAIIPPFTALGVLVMNAMLTGCALYGAHFLYLRFFASPAPLKFPRK